MTNCDTMTTLAKNIRTLMKLRGMRQEDLAAKIGILRPNISRLLTNPEANPSLETIELIANALNVRVSELFEEISEAIPEKVAC
jgi:transcriptional regulator with XRE-family HTH domain